MPYRWWDIVTYENDHQLNTKVYRLTSTYEISNQDWINTDVSSSCGQFVYMCDGQLMIMQQ